MQRLKDQLLSFEGLSRSFESQVSDLSLCSTRLQQENCEYIKEIDVLRSEIVTLNKFIENTQVAHELHLHRLSEDKRASSFETETIISSLQTQIKLVAASKESATTNLSHQLQSSLVELRSEQDARAALQEAIKELDSKLARLTMDSLKTSDALAIANRSLVAKDLEMERETTALRLQYENVLVQRSAERESFQQNFDALMSENVHLKAQAKRDREVQFKEFEEQLATNQELSDRLFEVEKERSELEASFSSAHSENGKRSSVHSADQQGVAVTEKAMDSISSERSSTHIQLALLQRENIALEHELTSMKQIVLLSSEDSSSDLQLRKNYDDLVQAEHVHIAKIASLESDLTQIRKEYTAQLLRARMNDALYAEHEVLKELLGATKDAGPIEKLQCLQWELQTANSELESFKSNHFSALNVDLQKSKDALLESRAIMDSSSEAARIAFEGLNAFLFKFAASKQLPAEPSIDIAAVETRLPWLKLLHKLAPPASFPVVQSIISSLARMTATDEEHNSESAVSTDDTEVHILKFKLRAMAAQLSRAEKCLLETSPSSLKMQAETLTARNLALETKIAAGENAMKMISADRDDCMKRYASLVSSFSQLSNLNNHIVREVVTLRRKLKAEQAGGNSESVHLDGSRDFDKEVAEAANAFSECFNQVVLVAVEGEAFRSAKKRSIMQEQNEQIITLRKELSDLKQANAALQVQLQDALQATKAMATSALQLQPVVNVPALYTSAFITDPASKFTERSAEEEFLTIRLKVFIQFIS